MQKLISFLNGKKTYIIGSVSAILGIVTMSGLPVSPEAQEAIVEGTEHVLTGLQLLLGGLAAIGLRAAVAKK